MDISGGKKATNCKSVPSGASCQSVGAGALGERDDDFRWCSLLEHHSDPQVRTGQSSLGHTCMAMWSLFGGQMSLNDFIRLLISIETKSSIPALLAS